jgi:polar amino acid transport system substrate-binding protein
MEEHTETVQGVVRRTVCPGTRTFGRRFFIAVFVCGLMPARVLAAGGEPLRVGMELAYPPFEMSDTRGAPCGVSVDLARALGGHLGREVEIVNIPFDGLIPSLKTGKIDAIISSMTVTEERRRSVDFSNPYLRTGLSLLVAASSDVGGVEDLARGGRKVAVKRGTTGHLYAERELAGATVRVLDKETACVLEVVQGRVDAFLYDQLSVYRHWSKNRETTKPVLTPFQREEWAVAVRKGNSALLAEVNEFLEAFRARGGFDELAGKYLSDERRAFLERGEEFVF